MNDIDITAEELRLVILELCKQASGMAGDAEGMIRQIERIAQLTELLKRKRQVH